MVVNGRIVGKNRGGVSKYRISGQDSEERRHAVLSLYRHGTVTAGTGEPQRYNNTQRIGAHSAVNKLSCNGTEMPPQSMHGSLVPRTRSSHDFSAGAFANFGFKSGTRIIDC